MNALTMFANGKHQGTGMGQARYDGQEELLAWAQQVIGCQFRPDAKAIGWLNGETIRAVTVFDGFSQCDCNMHIASDGTGNWLTKEFLCRSFAYPFIQLGLRRVTGLVPAKNENAVRFDIHLGFEYEGKCRNALPDDDIIVLGMLREDCRFLPSQYRSTDHAG